MAKDQAPTTAVESEVIQQIRAMNEALLISLVRQHELAAEFRVTEERLRLVMDSVPQKIFTATPAGALGYFNPQWVEYLGHTDAEMHDWGWEQLVHSDDAALTTQAWERSMATGEPFLTEHRLRRADGEYRWHMGRALPTRNEKGEITLWVGSDTDVEDVKQIESAVRQRLQQEVDLRSVELLSVNEQLQGFTYSVAHDLRQRVRGIVANASILLSDGASSLTGESQATLHRLIFNSKRLAVLVDDLLTYARLGKQEPIKLPFDMTALAEEVAAFLIEQGVCRPETRIRVARGLLARGDVQLIRVVMENLLENACKFSAEKEIPIIVVDRSGDAIFVRDNGIGFDMQFVDKLFQPLERLHRDMAYPGTGIGLANVKRIVEKHGGKVWAEGVPEEGATFYFSLS